MFNTKGNEQKCRLVFVVSAPGSCLENPTSVRYTNGGG